MKLIVIQFSILCFLSINLAANYPFPQNKVAYGIKTTSDVASDVESVYQSWLSRYYREQDSLARITWDNDSQTVSEGIGYGMLIMVCMDNAQNNTRPKFDKLWRYYKKFRDNDSVMNWKINGFTSVADDGSSGATDAEMDVATALVLAFRQWGDSAYCRDAQTLINAIWTYEVNSNGYLKPGDIWDNLKDPSYFSTGGMQLFQSVDAHDWSTVMANSFSLLKKVCQDTTGLPPDWCSEDGASITGEFGWEAVRVPWRMAWAYSWFGQQDAAEIDAKIVTWIRTETQNDPTAIKSLYTRAGVAQSDTANTAFTGALTCAGMPSVANQDWVNAGFTATKNALANTYYKKTLQVLYMLLLSGNFPLMTDSPSAIRQLSPVQAPGASRHYDFTTTNRAGQYFSLNGKKQKDIASPAMQPLIRLR
jgi:endo-1,4-beta-D-glucanase Y